MVKSSLKWSYSLQEIHKAKRIKFGIFSEEEILQLSVCEVNSLKIYNYETGLPEENGINDPRMGVTSKGILCQTCFSEMKDCPGHFGHIRLAEPVFNCEFLKIIMKILKCICYNCSKILLTQDKISQLNQIKNLKMRLREMYKSASNECIYEENQDFSTGCGCKQPKYYLGKNEILIKKSELSYEETDTKRLIRPHEVLDIFKRMSDETIKILGFDPINSRPENMIIKVLIVAPPSIRPSIELASTAKSEDDITHMYQTIILTNSELIKAKQTGLSKSKIDDMVITLQNYIAYLYNNEEGKARQKGGRPIKSIRQRLKGKEGRLRGNLMGKRVDFSARSVVSPDPNLELDELGVPKQIAMDLTIPETVTPLNIDFLNKLIERGDEWPGAKYFISKVDGSIIDLNYVKTKPTLQYGDIVERHLNNGDYVLFNRQPSLHRMSIMGHRVRVLPFSTFRLNLSVTTPYNADFDGDEMNMHVPQNLETKSEVIHIMEVSKQIITPQSNRPVMGLNQDTLLGIRLFTRRDVFLTKSEVFDLLMFLENWDGNLIKPAILKPKPLWTGKQIISLLLPKINYFKYNEKDQKSFYLREENVIINKGELLAGNFSKPIVGNSKGSLIGCLWIDFGPQKTNYFLTYSQKIINNWLVKYGFTVGIEDTIASVDILKEIENKRKQYNKEFYYVLKDTQKTDKEIIIHQPGKTIIESFEHKANTLLNDCRAEIGKLLNENINEKNNIKKMILSGSKGNNINISQIAGLVGQQNVEGKRIPFGFLKRTLPHFVKDDYGPESRGFVGNSYYKGLNPQEFYFHTMGGREGLIDTAVKTSATGYMQRRLVKAMEDIMVQYDGTVRDSYSNIVQFLYGEDGLAGEFIEEQNFDIHEISDDKLKGKCCFFEIDENKNDLGFEDSINKYYEEEKIDLTIRENLILHKEAHEILYNEYLVLVNIKEKIRSIFKPGEKINYFPVNINRLISYSLFNFQKNNSNSNLNPLDCIQKLNDFLDTLKIIPGNCELTKINNEHALYLFKSFLKYKLCSKKIILEYGLNIDSFDYLLNEIKAFYLRSFSHPGEMTGSIAAQSIGETLTQMTLNTFHFAGVSSQNITLGVPRIQEIINCNKNIKGPSMTIYLKQEFQTDPIKAQEIISNLEYTTMKHIIKVSEIYFDPDPRKTIIEEDQDLIFYDEDPFPDKQASPWVLRFQIDPVFLNRKGLRLNNIIEKIENNFSDKVEIIESLETSDPIILRLRIINENTNNENEEFLYYDIKKIENYLLEDFSLKGFCKKVSFRKQQIQIYSNSGLKNLNNDGEYVLETSGTDIRRVLEMDDIDTTRSVTNHIQDIYTVFGIEATRIAIMNEIKLVFKFFNIYVNYRHLTLLADCITAQGKMMSISRNGINRVYKSSLRKCSFEETVDILIDAAAFSETDFIKGVSESVITGQLAKIGTGSFDILMDEYYLMPNEDDKDKILTLWKYFPDVQPILEVEEDINDDFIKTPGNLNTPKPGGITPKAEGFNVGDTPDMRTPFNPTPILNVHHSNNNTPYLVHNDLLKNQSPAHYNMLNYNNQGQQTPFVPMNTNNLQSGNYANTGNSFMYSNTDLKYSPISPNPLNSPKSIIQGNMSRHLTGMTPNYSYKLGSSQYNQDNNKSNDYNQNSSSLYNSNSSLINVNTGLIYNIESPVYDEIDNEKVENEGFSEEEK